MVFLWKKNLLNKKKLFGAIDLWDKSFTDGKKFASYFIKKYTNNFDYLYAIEKDRVISMAYVIKKSILIKGQIKEVFLIAGVATDKNYLRKGFMKKIVNMILEKFADKIILIQSENWEYYNKFDFHNTSKIYEYEFKNFKKKQEFFNEKINWNEIIKISNSQGSVINSVESFKEYIKMLKLSGGIFDSKNDAYIIYEKNIVYEFGYKNIENLFFLLSKNEIKILKSYFKINSKFLHLKSSKIFTKSNIPELNLIFNCLF